MSQHPRNRPTPCPVHVLRPWLCCSFLSGDHLFGVVDPATGRFTQRAELNCTEPKCLPVRTFPIMPDQGPPTPHPYPTPQVLGSPADYAPDSKVYLTQLGTGDNIDFLAVCASEGY